ncbi:cell division protein FtsQ/DivIB [Sphingomonas sp. BN140010]|uniref:Cell division protein FtsQ n=1 Tax=Sphingomonas arvum TaxID=2992113 RepID=A0ABT3JGX3_9SPHN|nr:cell division protein FtsQ/DivIB [Sphingomonas sp. BN140010]MCW3798337.1 cell division protein FtsQ/DivIB [Sphingomonas sp. BN140010]
MNAQTVRRGSAGTRKGGRKPAGRSAALSTSRGVNKLARWAIGVFIVAILAVAIVALDLPVKAGRALGAATGQAGFAVDGYQIVGLKHMDRGTVDDVVTTELHRAAEQSAADDKPAQALVSATAIRDALLQYGWVKDARVSRRLPDQLVIDIVERKPAAVWQHKGQLSLIDGDGVVLAPVPLDKMPDLPLLIGQGANAHAVALSKLMAGVPTLKPQLASASWVGGRRWDLAFSSGEVVALPEGDATAATVLKRFAKHDRDQGLLGRGVKRYDLRVPGKMTVRLPEPLPPPEAAAENPS